MNFSSVKGKVIGAEKFNAQQEAKGILSDNEVGALLSVVHLEDEIPQHDNRESRLSQMVIDLADLKRQKREDMKAYNADIKERQLKIDALAMEIKSGQLNAFGGKNDE